MKRRRVKQRSKIPKLLILLGISVLAFLFTTFLQIRRPYKSSAQTPSFTCKVNAMDYTKTALVYCSTKPQSGKLCYPANPPFVIDCGAVRANKVGNVCFTATSECKNNIMPTAIIISRGVPKATIVPTLKVSPTATPFSINSLLIADVVSTPSQGEKLFNQVTTKINSKGLLLLAVYVGYGNNSSSSLCNNKDYPVQT